MMGIFTMGIYGIKKSILLYGVTIIVIVLSWGLAVGSTAKSNQSDRLRIIYSGGLTGNIEPCG